MLDTGLHIAQCTEGKDPANDIQSPGPQSWLHDSRAHDPLHSAEVRLDCRLSYPLDFWRACRLRQNPSLQVELFSFYNSVHVKQSVTYISDYARNINIKLDPIRVGAEWMG